ncbi:MAG TPA: hypothetical protein VIK99_07935, partial [Thermaerobacter sp.]
MSRAIPAARGAGRCGPVRVGAEETQPEQEVEPARDQPAGRHGVKVAPEEARTEELVRLWQELPEFPSLVDGIRRELPAQAVYGITGPAAASLLAALSETAGRSLFVLTADQATADAMAADLRAWLPEDRVAVFPAVEVLPFEVLASSPELRALRLAAMARLRSGRCVVVAPVAALARRLADPSKWETGRAELVPGATWDRDDLVARLVASGYERAEQVERPGEFAVRGGIVDVFPPTEERPVRIEFFDDEIESIRVFDVASQRSTGELRHVTLL